MSELQADPDTRALLSPRKLVIQVTGFVIGIGLLAWIIHNALREGNWERIVDANPLLILALVGCTGLSVLVNGTSFWVTIRPIKPLRFWDLQRLNLLANMLNYAPVRLGAIARVLYHVRVDSLTLLQIGAWFSLVAYILVLGVGSVIVASFVRDRLDAVWLGLVAGQMILGGLVTRIVAGQPLIARYARGLDRLVTDPRSLWGAVGARAVDLGAFSGRMAVAAAILDIRMPPATLVVLGMVGLAASLIPFGRLGFKEFCVAMAGQRLNMAVGDVEANMNQLALIDSVGEVLVYLPGGLAVIAWYRRRWRQGSWTAGNADTPKGE